MGIESLKNVLKSVPEELMKLRSHDKHDYWLVEEIRFKEKDYFDATHVLIGCPQHEGVYRNNGRIGAEKGPNRIREQLYKLQIQKDHHIKLFDAGNIGTDFFDVSEDSRLMEPEITDALDKVHESLTKAVAKFLSDGKRVIVLGGGNDISYSTLRALSETEREISAINMDAHLDMRIANEMTSGTPYRKAIDDHYLVPQHFYEFGIRPESNGVYYLEYARELGVNIHTLEEIIEQGVISTFQNILGQIGARPFFLGLDMDSIQAADAPGVSASSPIGFSGREVMQCIHLSKQKENLKLFEITEVNPKYDVDDRTVKLAAQLVYNFLFG